MTDFTYDQLSVIHQSMCLAWSMSPRNVGTRIPEWWPEIWDDETPPPWKPLWRDFVDTLDVRPFPRMDYSYDSDIVLHLNTSLRLDSPPLRTLLNRPLLWEPIWLVKQYLNELSIPAPAPAPAPTVEPDDTEGSYGWEPRKETCHKALHLLDSVMDSEDRVLSEHTYVELCNSLKELYETL